MTARCPKDPAHRQFITTAHEQHDWLVDEHGQFIEDIQCIDVTAKPDPRNTWSCAECFAEAIIDE